MGSAVKGLALLLQKTQVQFTAPTLGKSLPSVTPNLGLLMFLLVSAFTQTHISMPAHACMHALYRHNTHKYTHSFTQFLKINQFLYRRDTKKQLITHCFSYPQSKFCNLASRCQFSVSST